jgi:surface polysaccharide O-acyltransferase-like enzyme
MTKQEKKLLIVIVLIQIGVQIILFRPTDPIWIVPLLATISTLICIGIYKLAQWIMR